MTPDKEYEEAFNDGINAAINFIRNHVPNFNKSGTLIHEPFHGEDDTSRTAYCIGLNSLKYGEQYGINITK